MHLSPPTSPPTYPRLRRGAGRARILMAAALLTAAVGAAAQEAGDEPAEDPALPPSPGVLLPEGSAARAWAGVDGHTAPAELPTRLRVLQQSKLAPDGKLWSDPRAWPLWGRLVAEERDAEQPDAGRRAALCLLAARQGRTVDAWAHFATLTASPGHAAAVLPYLMPGIPPGAGVDDGGLPLPLENGVVLRPLTPPVIDPARPYEPRSVEVHGLRIGAGRIGMIVRFESSGIEIEVSHEGGEPVDVAIAIPEPEGLEMFVEYTDWSREEDLGVPRAIRLAAGEEPLSLYGRFSGRDATEPTGRVERVPAPLLRGGLFLDGPQGSAEDPLLIAAAATLQELLGFPVSVREAGDPAQTDGPSGAIVHLTGQRERRLAYLASRVEAFLLGGE